MTRNRMLGLLVAAGCAAVLAASADAQSNGQAQAVEVKYAATPMKGVEAAILSGPLDKQVLYTQRVRLAKGGLVPPHTHPDQRYTTVLSGTLYVCTGDTFSEKAVKAYPAGSFIITPANVVHCSWAKNGTVVYQESGIGPTATALVKK